MPDLVRLRQWLDNQKGAEVAEWVLWAGGLAMLAGAIYLVVAAGLPNAVSNVMSGISSSGS